jgi:hypothetical protein
MVVTKNIASDLPHRVQEELRIFFDQNSGFLQNPRKRSPAEK